MVPTIIGPGDLFQVWVHNQLQITPSNMSNMDPWHSNGSTAGEPPWEAVANMQDNVVVLAEVTAVVVDDRGTKAAEECKPYSMFQLAKLKVLVVYAMNATCHLFGIIFVRQKMLMPQWTQLIKGMKAWAWENDIQINRNVSFEKAKMDDNIKMEFCPGTPTAYLATAEQGISILTCCPWSGNETAHN